MDDDQVVAAAGGPSRHAAGPRNPGSGGPHRHRGPGGPLRLTRRGRLVVTSGVAILLVGTTAGILAATESGSHGAAAATIRVRASSEPGQPAQPTEPTQPPAPTATPSPSIPLTAARVPVAVTQAFAAAGGDLSVAVYDRAEGRTWTYHDEGGRVEASVSKLDVLGAVLRAQQAGSSVDDDVAEDETAMIEHSSNDAAVELYDRVGADGLEDFDEAVGAADVQYAAAGEFGLDTSTALDQVEIMKAYAYPSTVLTAASQARATALFGQVETDQHWGASGGVPAGVTVDLKNGWLPHGTGWVVNTVGHVTGQGHDYVVAIMSAGNSTEQAGIDRLEQVSAAVWATSGS